jgi:hypothetical protein
MTFRRYRLVLVSILALALSGCDPTGVPGTTPPATGGFVELAVSETCAEESNPHCIHIGDDYVMRPSTFEDAPVANAAASEGQQDAVDLTFTAEGAAVLQDLTDQAAQAEGDARLLLKAGGKIVGATVVMEALQGDHVTIALPPEHTAQEVLDLIHGT